MRVIDGDTVVLLVSGNVEERIRLSGIDCPERGQPFGTKAKEMLIDRVAGESVSVEWEKREELVDEAILDTSGSDACSTSQ